MNSPSFLLTLMGDTWGRGGTSAAFSVRLLPQARREPRPTPHPSLGGTPEPSGARSRGSFRDVDPNSRTSGRSCPPPRGGMPSEGPLARPHSWPPWEGGRFGNGGEAGDGRALSWGCSRVPGGREGRARRPGPRRPGGGRRRGRPGAGSGGPSR